MRTDIFGWFDQPHQKEPTHDPGFNGPCPVCAQPLSRPVTTISLMVPSDRRSYFFRAHKACWHNLSESEQNAIESSLVDEICGQPTI